MKRLGSLILAGLLAWSAGAQADTACATTPAARQTEHSWMSIARWNELHAAQQARAAQGGIDLMFVGDSITEGWPKDQWAANFGRFHPANFAIGGDHTGNVLYRLDDPKMAALAPRAIVLLIGVNNFFHCGDDVPHVFAGIEQVVVKLRAMYPQARILLNGVLPYGAPDEKGKRAQVRELNRLVATLADGRQVVYRDYGPCLAEADGTVSRDVMPDYLHPNAKGYRLWAEAMLPDIEKLMDEPK
jgi:lysophospholipase L1-like esterase